MKNDNEITVGKLRECLKYDHLSGSLTWKKYVSCHQQEGQSALKNINRDGYCVIHMARKSMLAQKAVYALMIGEFPKGILRLKDGNRQNLKWENIKEEQRVVGDFDHTTEEGRREYAREYKKQVPLKNRSTYLKTTYGIDLNAYEEMLKSQDGKCAVCNCGETAIGKAGPLPLAVDHDHSTGEVRSLLCRNCNIAIGLFHEKSELFHAAAKYLETHKNKDKSSNIIPLHSKGAK